MRIRGHSIVINIQVLLELGPFTLKWVMLTRLKKLYWWVRKREAIRKELCGCMHPSPPGGTVCIWNNDEHDLLKQWLRTHLYFLNQVLVQSLVQLQLHNLVSNSGKKAFSCIVFFTNSQKGKHYIKSHWPESQGGCRTWHIFTYRWHQWHKSKRQSTLQFSWVSNIKYDWLSLPTIRMLLATISWFNCLDKTPQPQSSGVIYNKNKFIIRIIILVFSHSCHLLFLFINHTSPFQRWIPLPSTSRSHLL